MYKPKDLFYIIYFDPTTVQINSTDYCYRKYKVLYQINNNEIFLENPPVSYFYKPWLKIIHSRNLTGINPKDFYLDTLNNL